MPGMHCLEVKNAVDRKTLSRIYRMARRTKAAFEGFLFINKKIRKDVLVLSEA